MEFRYFIEFNFGVLKIGWNEIGSSIVTILEERRSPSIVTLGQMRGLYGENMEKLNGSGMYEQAQVFASGPYNCNSIFKLIKFYTGI